MLHQIKIAKLNTIETLDDKALPEASTTFLTHYGATQYLNDGHAGIARKNFDTGAAGDTKYLAAVEKATNTRLEKLRKGDVPRPAVIDPLMVAARSTAKALEGAGITGGLTAEDIALIVAARAAKASPPPTPAPTEPQGQGRKPR